MNKNIFVDTAEILIKAGSGGDGKVSFRREKYIPRGGPDGGDGGDGGNVYLKVDTNMATLMDFRARTSYKAQSGAPGGSKKMSGLKGEDLIIHIPQGTLVYQKDSGNLTLIEDMNEINQTFLVAKGGKGGKGNERFKSSTNQTPLQYTPGTPGEEKTLVLEIKMIADVGLVGLPNAGKSTLINHLANTRAKVASYPFTTLNPNLGICILKDGSKVVIADIPGLIEGASEGKGLGDDFLRHVERTRIIVHIIDPFDLQRPLEIPKTAFDSYQTLRNELKVYGKGLTDKKELIVVNKIDIPEVKENIEAIKTKFKKIKKDIIFISSLTGEGLDLLINKLTEEIAKTPKTPMFNAIKPTKVYTISDLPNKRMVFGSNEVKTIKKRLK